jgi:hypothetical protein
MLEHLREERVGAAVVEGDVGRRPDDDERLLRIEREPLDHGPIRFEVGEVVLLLEPLVLPQLRGSDPIPRQSFRRDCVGHDDVGRRTESQLVLEPRELVVEGCCAGDVEAPRGDRQLVGAVRERVVEPATSRPAS